MDLNPKKRGLSKFKLTMNCSYKLLKVCNFSFFFETNHPQFIFRAHSDLQILADQKLDISDISEQKPDLHEEANVQI